MPLSLKIELLNLVAGPLINSQLWSLQNFRERCPKLGPKFFTCHPLIDGTEQRVQLRFRPSYNACNKWPTPGLTSVSFSAAACGKRSMLVAVSSWLGSMRLPFNVDEQRLEKLLLGSRLPLNRLTSGVASRSSSLICMPAFARINKGDDPAFDTWVQVHHSRFGRIAL